MKLKIKYLDPNCVVSYAHEGDAGIDVKFSGNLIKNLDTDKEELFVDEYSLKPMERVLFKTGLKLELPKGHYISIRDRSGLALKHGLHTLAGVIDENYRGELGIILINLSSKNYIIKKYERIAQMILMPYVRAEIVSVDSLSSTDRGEGGFGSSGK